MSQYSIFHTSHCGSTLLAAMLSKSIPTITEPDWSHRIHKQPGKTNTINFISSNYQEDTLVKYSSMYCYVAPLVGGKKVFLYRTLQSHLEKMLSNSNYLVYNSEYTLNVLKGNLHKKLGTDYDTIKRYDPILSHALLWADRYLHINDSADLILVDSSDFLNDKQKTAKQICDFFELVYIPVDGDFNAKLSGLNHNNTPISISNKKLISYNLKNTKVSNPLLVSRVIDQVKKYCPSIPDHKLWNR